MEEHIKKYSQIAQTGHYEPPKIEESKNVEKLKTQILIANKEKQCYNKNEN